MQGRVGRCLTSDWMASGWLASYCLLSCCWASSPLWCYQRNHPRLTCAGPGSDSGPGSE